MKERGILFTPANIKLIRDKRKWQTRRVIETQPKVEIFPFIGVDNRPTGDFAFVDHPRVVSKHIRCPYGFIGDRLYIKEGIIRHVSIPQIVGYYMDGCRVTEQWEKRQTAMFMPKWAARTWLEITDVKVERLQDISEEDARAEGVEETGCWQHPHESDHTCICYRDGYRKLWDSINKKKHPWESNPWVWVLEFKLIK